MNKISQKQIDTPERGQKKDFLMIPVDQAKQIAKSFDKDQVIIISWNREHHSETITTYGKSIHDSDQAAAGGNLIKKSLRWPDKDCNGKSVRVEALLNGLEAAKLELMALNAEKSTAYIIIEKLLQLNSAEEGADHA